MFFTPFSYGKMKDQFGWPDDTEEISSAAVASTSLGQSATANVDDGLSSTVSQPVAGPLDK